LQGKFDKLKKIITKLFWTEGQEHCAIEASSKAAFVVKIGKLVVETLEYNNARWTFSYSDEFKNQNEICALANFLSKEKVYRTKDLWPLFASRIPSQAQLQGKGGNREDLISLLKKFGQKTVANPFEIYAVLN